MYYLVLVRNFSFNDFLLLRLRFLRNQDRQLNEHAYPKLFYPELYLLEGGYKSFYEIYKVILVFFFIFGNCNNYFFFRIIANHKNTNQCCMKCI
jgi:hypothetical protein